MKKSKIIAAFAASLIAYSANAMDAWEGSKFIYTTSAKAQYALKVDLNDDNSAKVAYINASGKGTYSQEGDFIKIKLIDEIESFSFPVKKSPITGLPEQVTTIRSIKKITLKGSKDNLTVVESGTVCSLFSNDDGPALEDCTDFTTQGTDISKHLLARSSLNPVSFEITNGDKVVVPIEPTNRAYVEIDRNGNASPVNSDLEINRRVKSVVKSNGKIKVTLIDDSTINFGQTVKVEGYDRVLGIHKKNNVEKLVSGVIVVDQEVDLSSFEPSGTYKVLMAEGLSNYENLEYQFNPDGFGGFESILYDNFDYESIFYAWSWNFKDMEIHASSYKNEYKGQIIHSIEDVKDCVVTEDKLCNVHIQRSYKILAVDGNRYTMLRTMDVKFKVDPHQNLTQSVWVMYKK